MNMEDAVMPGLKLTFWQAQRLWNLSSELCERALTALIRARFLVPAPDGTYFAAPNLGAGRTHRVGAEGNVGALAPGSGGRRDLESPRHRRPLAAGSDEDAHHIIDTRR